MEDISYNYTQSPYYTPHNYPPEYFIAILDVCSQYRQRVKLALDTDNMDSEDTQAELSVLRDKIDQILAFFAVEDADNRRKTPV